MKTCIESAGFVKCEKRDFNSIDNLSTQDDLKTFLSLGIPQVLHGIIEKGGLDDFKTTGDAKELADAAIQDMYDEGRIVGFNLRWVWGRLG